MKKLLGATLLFGSLAAQPVLAQTPVTAWYQPTPYPVNKFGGTAMPTDITIEHFWEGWLNNSYNKQLVERDDTLQIGGWGDTYASVLRFDLTGLPATVTNAYLYLWALPTGAANSSLVALYPITSTWNPTTISGNAFPQRSPGYYWPTPPTVNAWGSYWITPFYTGWKGGTIPDQGMLMMPYNNDGTQRFDKFVSSTIVDDTLRPILRLDFAQPAGMPNFKMPVPGGAKWLLTNEIGGYECLGQPPWPDTAHQGNSYFSIDISPTNKKTAGGSYTGDIPVLAAANGIVAYVETNKNVPNGYHIVINHSGSASTTSGYTTKYLHFKDIPRRSTGTPWVVGNSVSQGDQIGIMGTTGVLSDGTPTSTAVHVHLGIYKGGSGAASVPELTYAMLDGLLMKSYQTECSVNSSGSATVRIRYYPSSNRAY